MAKERPGFAMVLTWLPPTQAKNAAQLRCKLKKLAALRKS
jgi:hypothetical protein